MLEIASILQPVALTTGAAASGMSLALKEHLVAQGCRVVVADVNRKSGTKVSKKLAVKFYSEPWISVHTHSKHVCSMPRLSGEATD